MAKATSKAATVTTLAIGKVEVGVGLFTAHADPKKKLVEFDTAGPNGGVLKMRSVARPAPVEEAVERPAEPVVGDPLGDDLFADAPPSHTLAAAAPGPTPLEAVPVVDEPAMAAAGLTGEQFAASGVAAEDTPGWPGARPEPQFLAAPDGQYGTELVEEGTGEIVLRENVRRGVRLEDGSFVDCTHELERIDTVTKLEKMTVVGFVDSTAIARYRVSKAYWLGAMDERAPYALRVILEGLKRRRRVGLAKVTKRSRQSLGVIAARGDCLMFLELVWAEDLREAPAKAKAVARAKVSEQSVERMAALVDAMALTPAAVDELRDDAIALREDLHARALRGEVEAQVADVEALEEDNAFEAQLEAALVGVA